MAATIRDVFIIILAIQSLIIGVFLILVLWQLLQLVKILREEVIPLLNTTRETVDQMKHTTTFVGQSVAAPLISVSGLIRGIKEATDTLRGKKDPHEYLKERHDG